MSDRRPIIGGNWKMNTTLAGARDLAQAVVQAIGQDGARQADVVLFPPFVSLAGVAGTLGDGPVALGAQDVYHESDGAFTGEISCAMLADCGCGYVLTGHSERRHVIGESDDLVGLKTRAAIASGLHVILCVGELLEEREAGQTDAVNERQLRAALAGLGPDAAPRLTIAYEPVWAIGTGKTATPADAQAAHARIRQVLGELMGDAASTSIRIQYGGSVKPANAAELFGQPDIDGGLIGGASLKAEDFASIVRAACSDPARPR